LDLCIHRLENLPSWPITLMFLFSFPLKLVIRLKGKLFLPSLPQTIGFCKLLLTKVDLPLRFLLLSGKSFAVVSSWGGRFLLHLYTGDYWTLLFLSPHRSERDRCRSLTGGCPDFSFFFFERPLGPLPSVPFEFLGTMEWVLSFLGLLAGPLLLFPNLLRFLSHSIRHPPPYDVGFRPSCVFCDPSHLLSS